MKKQLRFSNRMALAVLSLACPVAAGAQATDGSGLRLSVAADIVGKTGKAGIGPSDRLDAREVELSLYAPADHLFNGQVSLAAHSEEGEAVFELHEAFLGSTRLIPRSRFRIGKFFLGIGRLNQIHRHDWPFISAPVVHRAFFDDAIGEGIDDAGAEFSYLTPLPFVLDLTAGVTNGWTFGHAHDLGERPLFPTHYVRAASYAGLPWDGGLQPGLTYLGRKASNGDNASHLGVDLTAKWRELKTLRFLFQSEGWYRVSAPQEGQITRELGYYVYPQYGFTDTLSLGARFDYLTNLSLEGFDGSKLSNGTVALVPTLTYKSSEFVTLRSAYTYERTFQDGQDTQVEHAFELQGVFILGAHPAHDF